MLALTAECLVILCHCICVSFNVLRRGGRVCVVFYNEGKVVDVRLSPVMNFNGVAMVFYSWESRDWLIFVFGDIFTPIFYFFWVQNCKSLFYSVDERNSFKVYWLNCGFYNIKIWYFILGLQKQSFFHVKLDLIW